MAVPTGWYLYDLDALLGNADESEAHAINDNCTCIIGRSSTGDLCSINSGATDVAFTDAPLVYLTTEVELGTDWSLTCRGVNNSWEFSGDRRLSTGYHAGFMHLMGTGETVTLPEGETPVGTFGGGINESGIMVGVQVNNNPSTQPPSYANAWGQAVLMDAFGSVTTLPAIGSVTEGGVEYTFGVGWFSSIPMCGGINSDGDVTVGYDTYSLEWNGFDWVPNVDTYVTHGAVYDSVNGWTQYGYLAQDINDSGTVAYTVPSVDNRLQGRISDVGDVGIPGYAHSVVVKLNNAGDAIGMSWNDSIYEDVPWIRTAAGEYIIVPLLCGGYTVLTDINDQGWVTGYSYSADRGIEHAFLLAPEGLNMSSATYILDLNSATGVGTFTLTGAPSTKHWPTPYQVSSSQDDVLYAIVRRTVNGQTVRYIERKHNRFFGD